MDEKNILINHTKTKYTNEKKGRFYNLPKLIVAVVGRPNVGKSTLFNRLAGYRFAIVEDTPGVTRDSLYCEAEWSGRTFTLVDTGGMVSDAEKGSVVEEVQQQARTALKEADAILFVVDAQEGILPDDLAVADILRRTKKPLLVVANKVDDFKNLSPVYQFSALGLGEPIAVSALHGTNTGELLDRLVEVLPLVEDKDYGEEVVKLAVVGRPNVGKSSLVNCLLGQKKQIVSDLPGTTRDAVDSFFRFQDRSYVIIDTAGIRRKSRIAEPVERYSVIRALRAIDRSDVVLVVIDATNKISKQDKRILGYALENGKAAILVVNKWDLVEKESITMETYRQEIKQAFPFAYYVPVIFISALTGKRVPQVMKQVDKVVGEAKKKVSTSVLNDVINEAVGISPPPAYKGRRMKIYYATQVKIQPPTFVLFVNDSRLLHFSYRRYLENHIRQSFGFEGTPIWLSVRRKDRRT